jgi:hypothetical protein
MSSIEKEYKYEKKNSLIDSPESESGSEVEVEGKTSRAIPFILYDKDKKCK